MMQHTQRCDQRDAGLDHQRTGHKGDVSGQHICQSGAQRRSDDCIKRMQQECADQNDAITQIGITAGCRDRDLHKHGGYAD